jgi:hypothetical protein
MTTMNADAVRSAMQRADREQAFWAEHEPAYLTQYPDQFVAVHDDSVVATSNDLQRLTLFMREQGLNPTDVWVRFMMATPQHWSL